MQTSKAYNYHLDYSVYKHYANVLQYPFEDVSIKYVACGHQCWVCHYQNMVYIFCTFSSCGKHGELKKNASVEYSMDPRQGEVEVFQTACILRPITA